MTQHWAEANPAIHFSVMHLGWADTPGIHNNLSTTLSIYMCYINILGGNGYLFVSNRWKPEFLQDKLVLWRKPITVLVIFQLLQRRCLSSTRWWERGCALLNKEPTQWCGWPCPKQQARLAAASSSKVSCDSFPPSICLLFSESLTDFCIADRQPVSTHLPLAWTHSSEEDVEIFTNQLDALAKVIQSHHGAQPELSGPTGPSRTHDWMNFLIYFSNLLCEAHYIH